MSRYIVGVDGGGTKTLGVLFKEDGTIQKRVEYGFSNFRVDKAIAKDNLISTIDDVVQDIDVNNIDIIQIGVAGVPEVPYKEQLINELQERYQTTVSIVTDAEIALYSIRKDTNQCVIMVLGGTGSAVMVKNDEHDLIIGGFGHLLGDEGSGYHLAIHALRQVISQYEDNQTISPLSQAILEHIHAQQYNQIKDFVYNSSKQQIAQLSNFIATYALQGDEEAITLFKEEGIHLARQTITAFKKVQTCRKVIIGFRGNFLLHAPFVQETMLAELQKQNLEYTIDTNPVEPVVGAYYLGLSQLKRG